MCIYIYIYISAEAGAFRASMHSCRSEAASFVSFCLLCLCLLLFTLFVFVLHCCCSCLYAYDYLCLARQPRNHEGALAVYAHAATLPRAICTFVFLHTPYCPQSRRFSVPRYTHTRAAPRRALSVELTQLTLLPIRSRNSTLASESRVFTSSDPAKGPRSVLHFARRIYRCVPEWFQPRTLQTAWLARVYIHWRETFSTGQTFSAPPHSLHSPYSAARYRTLPYHTTLYQATPCYTPFYSACQSQNVPLLCLVADKWGQH